MFISPLNWTTDYPIKVDTGCCMVDDDHGTCYRPRSFSEAGMNREIMELVASVCPSVFCLSVCPLMVEPFDL